MSYFQRENSGCENPRKDLYALIFEKLKNNNIFLTLIKTVVKVQDNQSLIKSSKRLVVDLTIN